MLTICNQAIF